MLNKITLAAISVATVSAVKIKSQAEAQAEWKLWKKIKNAVSNTVDDVVDAAADAIGPTSGGMQSSINPSSLAQTASEA